MPTNPIHQLTLSRQRLGMEESCALLNTLDQPALILTDENLIYAVNAAAAELGVYSQPDLLGRALWMLFPNIIGGSDVASVAQELPNETIETTLLTHHNRRIPVSVKIVAISPRNNWQLLTFEPIEQIQRRRTRSQRSEQYFLRTIELLQCSIQVLNQPASSAGFDTLIEAAKNLAGTTLLAIYLGDATRPQLKKISDTGTAGELPNTLSTEETFRLIQSGLWTADQRNILTLTHQAARTAGYSFLACVPIGEPTAPIGLVLAAERESAPAKRESAPAERESAPADDLLERLAIIAQTIQVTVQQQATQENLQNQLEHSQVGQRIGTTVLDAMLDGVLILNDRLMILNINPSAEQQLGYTAVEVFEQPFDNILIGADRLGPALELAIQGIPTHNLGNVRIHRRDGSTFPARIATIPVGKIHGNSYALVILRDISEHENHRAQTQQLEQRALLGEITAVFAHEVRNPINNISTGLQLLSLQLPGDELQSKDLISRLQHDCNRLTELMESVLTFTRTGNYKFIPIAVPEFLEKLLNRWRPHLARAKVQPMISAAPDLPPIIGDRRALEQVLTNLISNAIRAMQDNGGTLAFKVSLHASPSNRPMLQIDISDTGPGIPEEIRERIFEPFFTTDPNGTGLGLSISKQIVTAHRGSIHLNTFPGGTIFTIRLPAAEDASEFVL